MNGHVSWDFDLGIWEFHEQNRYGISHFNGIQLDFCNVFFDYQKIQQKFGDSSDFPPTKTLWLRFCLAEGGNVEALTVCY